MLALGCLQPSTASIRCSESLQMEVVLELCLKITPAMVVLTKALYLQGLRLCEFRFYPSFSIVGLPPLLLVLARPGPENTLAVEDERVQFPLILIFIDAGALDSVPTIVIRIDFVALVSLGHVCCYSARVASGANRASNGQ